MKTVTQFLVLVILCTSLFSCTKELTEPREQLSKPAFDKFESKRKIDNPISIHLNRVNDESEFDVTSNRIRPFTGGYEIWATASGEYIFSSATDTLFLAMTDINGVPYGSISIAIERQPQVEKSPHVFTQTGTWHLVKADGIYKGLKTASGTFTSEYSASHLEGEYNDIQTPDVIDYYLSGFSN